MRVNANQLKSHLRTRLAPVYLICGDEPLLVDECCATVRACAKAQGFGERIVMTAEAGFDWNDLFACSHSISLFSPRVLIDLRIPGTKLSDAGADVLVQIAQQPPDDTLLLVSTGRLDKRAQASRWVKAIEAAGLLVIVYRLDSQDLPGWIAGRMRSRGLRPETGVAELLAYHFEGNLLGAAQEVDKLVMLRGQGAVSADDMRDNLSDNARFNVFTLVDTCLQGDLSAVTRILASLRGEGTEPTLILRVLVREARNLAQIAMKLMRGEQEMQNIWPRRRSLIKRALKRSLAESWLDILCRASHAEKVLKGQVPGDAWQELHCLTIAMCGSSADTCKGLPEGCR